ncbi:hypothetical protein VK70_17990 [Paenibacillus durus ATCC 35681]|uniref:Uncharacterized protein n=1 Tax=Paenibacillus durus ATCC 35681 TaxID=1333534 RepID=A0A0F7CJJ1_PAEDU|nr:hypothetical protein VK70_17990 [Paenibacillus durus ATCC 35681]
MKLMNSYILKKAKKDAKRMFSVCSILIGPPILITGRDEGGPDDINKSANENAGNYAHHHHSIPNIKVFEKVL